MVPLSYHAVWKLWKALFRRKHLIDAERHALLIDAHANQWSNSISCYLWSIQMSTTNQINSVFLFQLRYGHTSDRQRCRHIYFNTQTNTNKRLCVICVAHSAPSIKTDADDNISRKHCYHAWNHFLLLSRAQSVMCCILPHDRQYIRFTCSTHMHALVLELYIYHVHPSGPVNVSSNRRRKSRQLINAQSTIKMIMKYQQQQNKQA